MRHRILMGLPLLGAWLVTSLGSAEDEKGLRERVLREYPRAIRTLQAAFSNAKGSGVETKQKVIAGQEERSREKKSRYEFAVSGSSERLGIFEEGSETNPSIPFEKIFCVGPRESFILKRHARGATPELSEFGAGINESLRRSIKSRIGRYIKAASGGVDDISTLLQAHPDSLVGVHSFTVDGRSLVAADYKWQIQTKQSSIPVTQVVSLVLSPDEGWALREYSFGPIEFPRVHVGKIDYGPLQAGVPIPKRITVLLTPQGPKVPPPTITTFEFEKLELQPTPDSAFTLAAFGIGELEGPPVARPRSHNGYWFFAFAAIAFVVAVTLKVIASRSQR